MHRLHDVVYWLNHVKHWLGHMMHWLNHVIHWLNHMMHYSFYLVNRLCMMLRFDMMRLVILEGCHFFTDLRVSARSSVIHMQLLLVHLRFLLFLLKIFVF